MAMTEELRLTVENVGGIERAKIRVAPIALVASINAGGKSSLAMAVASALTGNPIPHPDLKRGDAALMVRDGEHGPARCVVERVNAETGEIIDAAGMAWPEGAFTTEGAHEPHASPLAAGVASLLTMTAKERATTLQSLIRTLPSASDIAAAFAGDSEIPAATVAAVVAKVEKVGWDDAHASAKEQGAKLKGAWEHIAGRSYGNKIAKTWRPEGWTDDLDTEAVETLAEAVTIHRAEIERLSALKAVSAEKVAEWRVAVEALPADEIAAHRLAGELETATAELAAARTKRATLPPDADETGMPCPHCKKPVVMKQIGQGQWEISKPGEALTPAARKKRRDDIAETDGDINRLQALVVEKQRAINDLEPRIRAAKAAQANLLNHQPAATDAAGDIEARRTALATAEKRVKAKTAHDEASKKAKAIATNAIIQTVLAPTGLRQKVMAEKIAELNAELARIAEQASWGTVTMDRECDIRYNGRPVVLCSASERYRANVMLALAIDNFSGSDMIVLDAADILDPIGRNQLLGLLVARKTSALITMTMKDPALVPNLAKAGYGRSYWIGAGVVEEIV